MGHGASNKSLVFVVKTADHRIHRCHVNQLRKRDSLIALGLSDSARQNHLPVDLLTKRVKTGRIAPGMIQRISTTPIQPSQVQSLWWRADINTRVPWRYQYDRHAVRLDSKGAALAWKVMMWVNLDQMNLPAVTLGWRVRAIHPVLSGKISGRAW